MKGKHVNKLNYVIKQQSSTRLSSFLATKTREEEAWGAKGQHSLSVATKAQSRGSGSAAAMCVTRRRRLGGRPRGRLGARGRSHSLQDAPPCGYAAGGWSCRAVMRRPGWQRDARLLDHRRKRVSCLTARPRARTRDPDPHLNGLI